MMVRVHCLLALKALTCSIALSGCVPTAKQEDQIKVISADGIELRVYDNSATLSQILAINEVGQVIGMRESVDESGAVFEQVYFYGDGSQIVDVPLLEGFTNVEAKDLSDDGKVAGYVSRWIKHPEGNQAGFVWDSRTNKLTKLAAPPGDLASHASAISADGKRISGYSIGARPPRLRPCVWTWNTETLQWDVEDLPVPLLYNPFLTASGAVISPDGNLVAASISEQELPTGGIDVSLYVWQRVGDAWERKLINPEAVRVNAINNRGEMVGEFSRGGKRIACHLDPEGKLTEIAFLPGDVAGEANDINNDGVVVGFSDDPPGPDGGPQGFTWKDGKTLALEMPADNVFSVASGINDQGQIVGFADVTLTPDAEKPESADAGSEELEPVVKTLGFIWSKKKESN